MARILITPEEMDQIAKQFLDGASQSEQLTSKLNSAISSLQSQWDGATQSKFIQRYEVDKKNMQTYIENLKAISEELKTIANRFRQADQQG